MWNFTAWIIVIFCKSNSVIARFNLLTCSKSLVILYRFSLIIRMGQIRFMQIHVKSVLAALQHILTSSNPWTVSKFSSVFAIVICPKWIVIWTISHVIGVCIHLARKEGWFLCNCSILLLKSEAFSSVMVRRFWKKSLLRLQITNLLHANRLILTRLHLFQTIIKF